jgi:tight adherence protein B
VTAALLCGAGALLAWPVRRPGLRLRVQPRIGPARVAAGFRAALDRPVPTALLGALAGGAAGGLAGVPLVAVLAAVGGAVAVRAWRGARRAAGEDARVAVLTDALAALAAELRSGRPLDAATAAATAGCGDDLVARSLAWAVTPTRAGPEQGGPLGEALHRIAAAVPVANRTGCSLAAVLSAVEDDLRARRRRQQELRTETAGPRAGAAVLAGLPLLGLAMGAGVGADPWGVLTTTVSGQVLLVVGVGLELAGLAWAGRLVRRAAR